MRDGLLLVYPMICAYRVRVTKTVRYVVLADSAEEGRKLAVDAAAGRLKGGTNPIRSFETLIDSSEIEAVVPVV